MKVKDPLYRFPPKPIYVPPKSSTFERLNNDPNWIAEVKKDGWRMMIRVNPDRKIELWTRHATVELSPLPGVRSELAKFNLPPDTILDGELLEHRGNIKDHLMLWGMIRWEGKWTTSLPYKEIRWRMNWVPNTACISNPEYVVENKKAFYQKMIARGDEGIVMKKLDAPVPVSPKKSSNISSWLKVKPSA